MLDYGGMEKRPLLTIFALRVSSLPYGHSTSTFHILSSEIDAPLRAVRLLIPAVGGAMDPIDNFVELRQD